MFKFIDTWRVNRTRQKLMKKDQHQYVASYGWRVLLRDNSVHYGTYVHSFKEGATSSTPYLKVLGSKLPMIELIEGEYSSHTFTHLWDKYQKPIYEHDVIQIRLPEGELFKGERDFIFGVTQYDPTIGCYVLLGESNGEGFKLGLTDIMLEGCTLWLVGPVWTDSKWLMLC